ncbi:hypothetical protein [Butyricimonas paravirosa]|uniref:hypothetical protein n=1 Tax=Butyricimonas paravirosa TaxID=1472417 RepID=UPI002A7EEF7A|nr:hypothetical protein [Butyricimonas paravirosa]
MGSNKKIAVNSIIIFVRLCITSFVGIIASRLVLDALGATDYGLYNVVGGIVIILNVVNSSMASTTYRYIAYEIGRKGNSNKVFNTSFIIHFSFAIFIILLGLIVGEWYINNYLNVAVGKLVDAKFVFRVSILTTVISTILVPYKGLMIAYERFHITAIIEIFAQLMKLVAIALLLFAVENKIRVYSFIMMGYTLFESLSYFVYGIKNFTSIVHFKVYRDWKLYKEMSSFALWTLFGACASVGKTQGSAIIINFFFGTVVNAAFAVANQVENFILMFARSLNNAAIPQITKNFSGGDSGRSIKLTSYISKYTFLLMTFVAFPVILEIDFLLNIWLKEVPEGTATFCQLIILGGLLGCLGEGIPALVNATGNIKVYQIITHTFTLMGLPIAFICYQFFEANLYAILIIFCVINFLLAFIRLYLLKRIFNFNVIEFINTSYIRIFLVSIPLAIVYIFYNPSNFSVSWHIGGIICSELFLLIVIMCLGIDKKERTFLSKFLGEVKLGKH